MEKFFFKKIEMWVLLLLLLLALIFSVFVGWAVAYQMKGGKQLGSVGNIILQISTLPQKFQQVATASIANPYLATDQRFKGQNGFSFHFKPGSRPDSPFLLLSRQDPDAEIGISELVDLNTQKVVARQEWRVDELWNRLDFKSKLSHIKIDKAQARFAPYHTLITPRGEFITQYTTPLIKATACGKLDAVNAKYLYHHSLETDAEGNYWVPAHLEPKAVSLGSKNFLDDALIKISPTGKILLQKSISQLLFENKLGHLLTAGNDFIANDDPIHANDIQPVLNDTKYFRKGDLFVSLRHQSMVFLYRPSTNKILWNRQNISSHQHDINIISDHEISIFDNNTILRNGVRHVDGVNRFLIYDFATDKVSERFAKAFEKNAFKSPTNGRSKLLDANRLFVEESDFGRIAVISPQGSIDWQFINRDKKGQLYTVTWSRMIPRKLADKFLLARNEAKCD